MQFQRFFHRLLFDVFELFLTQRTIKCWYRYCHSEYRFNNKSALSIALSLADNLFTSWKTVYSLQIVFNKRLKVCFYSKSKAKMWFRFSLIRPTTRQQRKSIIIWLAREYGNRYATVQTFNVHISTPLNPKDKVDFSLLQTV